MHPIPFRPNAIAHIRGGDQAPSLHGLVKFYQRKHSVLISVRVCNLPPSKSGFFGFHIHDGTNCTGPGFSNTRSHYNPADLPHPSHPGDLPPLLLCNGAAFQSVATARFRLKEVIGRTVVIHSMPDDFYTQPAGNAGTKIACGVIRRV